MTPRFWRTAWRIAGRDLWSGRRHFAVALAALSVGVAAMNASRAVGGEFSLRLKGDMRQWIAADATVTLPQPPSEQQSGEMAALASQGIEITSSLETLTMASSDQAADPALVSVRSVDPRAYPWYGAVQLEPRLPLWQALRPDSAVVSPSLAERLAVAPGDRILIGGVQFRIAAILTGEPDRFAAAPNPYPRVMLSGAGFDRAQIARWGNSMFWRLLFRAGAASRAAGLKPKLQEIFPDGQVVDYRDYGEPRLAAALNTALTYLDLTAWSALALASLGVAMVIYLHMEQRLDTVAVIKVLGGRASQILAIYLLETGILALAGSALGVALAIPLERLFLWIGGDQLTFPVTGTWQWTQGIEGVVLGMLSSMAAAAMPLVQVRATAPLPLIRRYVEPRADRRGRPAGLLSLMGMVALAVWMAHSRTTGAVFLSGLACGGLILAGAGRGLLRLLTHAARYWKQELPGAWFYGMTNLGRPGRHGKSRFVALASAVMVVTAAWLGPAAVVRAIEQSLPLPGADLFVLGLGVDQTGPLLEMLRRVPGVRQPVELLPGVVLRLSKVAGAPAPATAPERFVATCSSAPPLGPLSSGRWWQTGAAGTEAVMAESFAGMLGVTVGQTLEFFAGGRAIPVRIVGLRRLDAIEAQRGGLAFPCTAFAGLRVSYEAGIRLNGRRAEEIRRLVAARYPSVPMITRQEVDAAIQSVAYDAIVILRAVAALILAAGIAILILTVLAEEKPRAYEIAILKAIGARPSQVRNGLLAELASLGALAGASGGVMGSLFASLLLSAAFHKLVTAWNWKVLAAAAMLGILSASAAGWAASARTLRQKPFTILRNE